VSIPQNKIHSYLKNRGYAVKTDRGSQFYANKKGKKGKGKSQFYRYLEKKGIKHI
jgi:hypothetical protein